VRGQKGVIGVTNLLRRSPFAEWTLVYFDPKKITENTIVNLMRKKGCPNARTDRAKGKSIAMNPVGGPGDTFLLRLHSEVDTTIEASKIPKNWVLNFPHSIKAGDTYMNLNTPRNASKGHQTIELTTADGTKHSFNTEIVGRIP